MIRSIAIGAFDGIHLGHQALIGRADGVVVIERFSGYLTPGHKRALYIDKPLFYYRFDAIKSLSPKAFIERLKSDFPSLEKIVVGYDFAFGKDRAADANKIKEFFEGKVEIVSEVSVDGISVHSRTIKALLKEGNLTLVSRLLSRDYRIEGVAARGQGIGSKELVPTINLNVEGYVLPKEGVYATTTYLKGVAYNSVTFIGKRTTTDGAFGIETHLIDVSVAVASCDYVSVAFHHFLRENRRFASLEALKEQIGIDIEQAKEKL